MEVDRNIIASTSVESDGNLALTPSSSPSSNNDFADQHAAEQIESDNNLSEKNTENDTENEYSVPSHGTESPHESSSQIDEDDNESNSIQMGIGHDLLFNHFDDFDDRSTDKTESSTGVNGSSKTALAATTTTTTVPPAPLHKISGKPKAFAIDAAAAAAANATKPRVRRKRTTTCMYQSQFTDKLGIKLKLKKSATPIKEPTGRRKRTNLTGATPTGNVKGSRKRSRKSKHNSDSDDDSDYERRRRKETLANNNTTSDKVKHRKSSKQNQHDNHDEPEEQSVWGASIPEHILLQIFEYAISQDGCLPIVVNMGKVCSLWQKVSLETKLWHSLDLSTWTKDRNELLLKWIIENRLRSNCVELNLANWKVTNIDVVLKYLHEYSPNLVSLNLSGWKGITNDHLTFLVQEFKSLSRIDLSSINFEMNPNKAGVGPQSICNAIQILGGRLTHLHLAHNRLGGVPQIITALSAHSTNLELLDLSNVSTVAASHGILHIEKLQSGCSSLKVLRITNSHLTLSCATLQEQMDSPGFPELEELSVASLTDESRLMNDECLQRILKTSTKLKLLDVRGCIRLTHDTFIRLPAWDLKHLFLSGCSVTRDAGSGLELIASKWAHSLTELDLAWANMQDPLDNALKAIAEKGNESLLNHLNLCGSSVSLEAVKKILTNCPLLTSINLSSCRGLPRGVKRLMQGSVEISELRENLGVTQQEENNTTNNKT